MGSLEKGFYMGIVWWLRWSFSGRVGEGVLNLRIDSLGFCIIFNSR